MGLITRQSNHNNMNTAVVFLALVGCALSQAPEPVQDTPEVAAAKAHFSTFTTMPFTPQPSLQTTMSTVTMDTPTSDITTSDMPTLDSHTPDTDTTLTLDSHTLTTDSHTPTT